MRLLLVRHGQTPSNLQHILDTVVPGPGLTDLGQTQAQSLADVLADEDIGAIITSNLLRTQQTAAPLAATRKLAILVRDGVGEIPAGTLEGSGAEPDTTIYRDVIFAWAAGDLAPVIPGTERDGAQMLADFDAVVAEAQELVGEGTAAIVSHGGAIRTWAVARATNVDAEFGSGHPLGNTGVVIMEGSIETGWTVERWDTAAAAPTPSAVPTMPNDWWQNHFDPHDPALATRLYGTLSEMRETCPVARSDKYDGFWVATTYEDVVTIAQDWETFSSAHGVIVPSAPIAIRNLPEEVDPPLQRTYKKLITPYFTPKAVAAFEQPTRALVNRLIDEFIESGSCELMDEFARPYPSRGFFELVIGAPPEDIERVAGMAAKASKPSDPGAAAAWLGLSTWIREFIETRQSQPPRGDIIDAIVHAEIDGRPITNEEMIGVVQIVILGGLETTASALGLWFHRFCLDPSIPAQLRENPALIPRAVEELLRVDSPFIAIARTAVQDGRIGDQEISDGDKVVMYWASANRDESEFPHADEFDIDRTTNRHVAFGVGPHRCAGSNLARMNLRIGLEESLRRLHDIKLQDGFEVSLHSTSTRSMLSLPITFTPGPRLQPAQR